MDKDPNKLTNVHEALSKATMEFMDGIERGELITFSMKIHSNVKDRAQEICERHGVTLASFFRHCAEALVRDYVE